MGEDPPPEEQLRSLAAMVGVAIAVVALIGVLIFLASPDDGLLENPLDDFLSGEDAPVWGTPGPMHGDPLDPGPCTEADQRRLAEPADVPAGAVLWLRADAGAEPWPGSDRVSIWRDRSGAGHDLRAPAGSQAPRLVERAWRCAPALRFAGGEHVARGDLLGIAPGSPRTFVVVARLRDPVERGQLFAQGEPGSTYRHLGLEANTWQTAGSRFGVYAVGSSFDAARPTDRSVAVHVLVQADPRGGAPLAPSPEAPPAIRYWIDGEAQALSLRSGPGTSRADVGATGRTSVGDFAGPADFFYRGDVFEVLVYGRALDGAERQQLESALLERYGPPDEDAARRAARASIMTANATSAPPATASGPTGS